MGTRVGVELSPETCRIVELDGSVVRPGKPVATRIRSFATLSPFGSEFQQALAAIRRRSAAVVLWGIRNDHQQVVVSNGSYEKMRREALAAASDAGIETQGAMADITPAVTAIKGARQQPVILALASSGDVTAAAGPIRDAGVRLHSLLTPAEALLGLARARQPFAAPGGIEAYVALEEKATCVALVRDGSLLSARELPWGYAPDPAAPLSYANQPRRDDLAARLVDELGDFLTAIGAEGNAITQVSMCGSLPELRTMAVPLMERLDVEVEPLDSLFGIDGDRLPDPIGEFRERAAEFRLAWAAAADWNGPINLLRYRHRRHRRLMVARAAAVAGVAAGLGAAWSVQRSDWWQDVSGQRLARQTTAGGPTPPPQTSSAPTARTNPQPGPDGASVAAPNTSAAPPASIVAPRGTAPPMPPVAPVPARSLAPVPPVAAPTAKPVPSPPPTTSSTPAPQPTTSSTPGRAATTPSIPPPSPRPPATNATAGTLPPPTTPSRPPTSTPAASRPQAPAAPAPARPATTAPPISAPPAVPPSPEARPSPVSAPEATRQATAPAPTQTTSSPGAAKGPTETPARAVAPTQMPTGRSSTTTPEPVRPPTMTVPAAPAPRVSAPTSPLPATPGPLSSAASAQTSPSASVPRAPAPTETSRPTAAGGNRAEQPSIRRPAEPPPLPFNATLGMILYSPDRKLAIVNGRIVGIGDDVGGARIVDMTPSTVLLRDAQGRLRSLTLGSGLAGSTP